MEPTGSTCSDPGQANNKHGSCDCQMDPPTHWVDLVNWRLCSLPEGTGCCLGSLLCLSLPDGTQKPGDLCLAMPHRTAETTLPSANSSFADTEGRKWGRRRKGQQSFKIAGRQHKHAQCLSHLTCLSGQTSFAMNSCPVTYFSTFNFLFVLLFHWFWNYLAT